VHIVELYTALVKVDTEVINVGLTQNQCLYNVYTMCTAGLNACWDTATARRHWTEQVNNDGMINLGDVHYQTEPNLSIFPKEI